MCAYESSINQQRQAHPYPSCFKLEAATSIDLEVFRHFFSVLTETTAFNRMAALGSADVPVGTGAAAVDAAGAEATGVAVGGAAVAPVGVAATA